MLIRIGTRASSLAVCQAQEVKNTILQKCPKYQDSDIEIIKITTSGDKLLDKKISMIGNKGLFTKEIEESLLNNDIDIAVHSMKDLPAILPQGLIISAVLPREDARDAFIAKNYKELSQLPKNAIIATSSIRRKAMLLHYRKDLNIIDIRGGIKTRLRKFKELNIDAMILAVSGLNRIGYSNEITQKIPYNIMLPAVGQGALAIESRADNTKIREILEVINHENTEISVNSERSFMFEIGGDCNTPMACYTVIDNDNVTISGEILHPLGEEKFSLTRQGHISDLQKIIIDMAHEMKTNAHNLLQYIHMKYNA